MTNEAQTHRPGMSLEDKLFDMLGAYTIIRNGIELFPNPEGITDKYIPDEIRAEIHREVVDRILRLAQIEERERLTEDDIYEILITQLPMRAYLSIPSPKLKEIATFIYQAQEKKRERREGSG